MHRTIVVMALVALLGLAGCGSGSGDPAETSAPVAVAQATPEQSVPPPLEELAGRLELIGLPAHPTYMVEGEAKMSIGGVEVTYFADLPDAYREAAAVRQIADNHPRQELYLAEGHFHVWAANQNGLTRSEELAFAQIAAMVRRLQ